MKSISNKSREIKELIENADCILIGAGAGLSNAAGIEYSGKRFEENFSDYIEKYHFTDMYSAAFYNFKTKEEKWAYWAKHIYMNNTGMKQTNTYKNILKLLGNKEYFVITTNVDDQFVKSGFNNNKIFTVQGSYRYIQCSKACHNKIYDDTKLVNDMLKNTVNLKIPTELIPKCPVCGKDMSINIRMDSYFVQDDKWYKQNESYIRFLEKNKDKKVMLLEFGVGFNTPDIIRFPFEQMVYKNKNWNLIRFNKEFSKTYLNIENKTISVEEDINEIIEELIN